MITCKELPLTDSVGTIMFSDSTGTRSVYPYLLDRCNDQFKLSDGKGVMISSLTDWTDKCNDQFPH